MRLSEIQVKEVIDVRGGERLGSAAGADLLIEVESGKIRSFSWTSGTVGRRKSQHMVPWDHVVRVGPSLVLVDLAREEGSPPRGDRAAVR